MGRDKKKPEAVEPADGALNAAAKGNPPRLHYDSKSIPNPFDVRHLLSKSIRKPFRARRSARDGKEKRDAG